MNLSLIAAMDNNRAIGKDNNLPWHLPADLQHFKSLTLGKPIIMGRKTYDSIGKALPDRHNIVISSQQQLKLPDCDIVDSIDSALLCAGEVAEVMIIGGASIFEQTLPRATTLYLTFVDTEIQGDAFFPKWDEKSWREVQRENHTSDERNKYNYSFVTLKKV